MRRGKQEIAANRLPVRPQHPNEPYVEKKEKKSLRQTSQKPLIERLNTPYPFKITIVSVSFSGYYPRSNPGKSE